MIGFQDEFENLPIPNTNKEHSYSAVAIKGFENHRIAKDFNENPCILVSITRNDQSFKVTRQKLYNLSITHNLICEIQIGNKKDQQTFSVIYYSGNDESLKQYFLKVCEILVPSLGNAPDNRRITQTVNKFIELFKALKEPPKNTLQGLWSELFLIAQSNHPQKLVRGWHSIPEEKYDFSFDKLRVEVKSTSSRNRIHHFSYDQLTPPIQSRLYIASLFTERSAGGKSLEDLIKDIINRLGGDINLIEKLNLVIYSTVGSDIEKIQTVCYDYELAKESLELYESEKIPKIDSIPDQVYDVHFKSSLESVSAAKIHLDLLLKKSKKGIY